MHGLDSATRRNELWKNSMLSLPTMRGLRAHLKTFTLASWRGLGKRMRLFPVCSAPCRILATGLQECHPPRNCFDSIPITILFVAIRVSTSFVRSGLNEFRQFFRGTEAAQCL